MLSKRLENIISALPQCKTLADIGCDHGYIGLEALRRNTARQVVFVDISAPSLNKAREHCGAEFASRAKFVCQDGLQNIACDCAVIAGMGGLEIISVLRNAQISPRFLVLQPMRSQQDVRCFLMQNYCVKIDYKFFDDKFYDLIFAEKCIGGSVLTDDEIEFGKTNLAHPSLDFLCFLHRQLNQCDQILARCDSAEVAAKRDEIKRIMNYRNGGTHNND